LFAADNTWDQMCDGQLSLFAADDPRAPGDALIADFDEFCARTREVWSIHRERAASAVTLRKLPRLDRVVSYSLGGQRLLLRHGEGLHAIETHSGKGVYSIDHVADLVFGSAARIAWLLDHDPLAAWKGVRYQATFIDVSRAAADDLKRSIDRLKLGQYGDVSVRCGPFERELPPVVDELPGSARGLVFCDPKGNLPRRLPDLLDHRRLRNLDISFWLDVNIMNRQGTVTARDTWPAQFRPKQADTRRLGDIVDSFDRVRRLIHPYEKTPNGGHRVMPILTNRLDFPIFGDWVDRDSIRGHPVLEQLQLSARELRAMRVGRPRPETPTLRLIDAS
jgi:hypothetical protein